MVVAKVSSDLKLKKEHYHYLSSVLIRSFSGPHFSAFGGKIRTRKTPNVYKFTQCTLLLCRGVFRLLLNINDDFNFVKIS